MSRPCVFSGDLHQTSNSFYRQAIIHYDSSHHVSPSVLIESLEFDCQITDSNGRIMIDSNFAGRTSIYNASRDKSFTLLLFLPFDTVNYTLTFTVSKNAPNIKSLEQRILRKYLRYGCELIPAVFSIVFAIGSFLLAATIIIIAVINRNKRSKAETSQNVSTTEPQD